jgi:hypothetical protein
MNEGAPVQPQYSAAAREIFLCAKHKDMKALEQLLHPEVEANVDTKALLAWLSSYFSGEYEARFHHLLRELFLSTNLTIALTATFLASAAKAEALNSAELLVRKRMEDASDFRRVWGEGDLLIQYRAPPSAMKILAELKYGFSAADPERGLLSLASLAAERLHVRPVLGETLFQSSPFELSRQEWDRLFRVGLALDHLVADRRHLGITTNRVLSYADMPRWTEIANALQATPRMVCVMFHGAHLSVTRALHSQQDGWIALQANEANNRDRVAASTDTKRALFLLFRQVENGKRVLIAPDGRWGKRLAPFTILGRQFTAGEGAAFIAYHARAELHWLHMEMRDDRFLPVCIKGPSVAAGESYQSYKERWNDFYANQIRSVVTGRPEGIALRMPWLRVFGSSLAPRQDSATD